MNANAFVIVLRSHEPETRAHYASTKREAEQLRQKLEADTGQEWRVFRGQPDRFPG